MKLVFIGMSSDYSLKHLEALEERFAVVMIICAAPRGYQGSDEGFSHRNVLYKNARRKGIPFYFSKNISSNKMEALIRQKDIDLICVASCSQLIKKNIIDIPRLGAINAHPAKLPYYKGPNPDYWIFYYQEKEGASTIHYIDEGEDSGDIINQELFEIPFGMTKKEYRKKILSHSPKLMQRSVQEIMDGVANRIKQPDIKTIRARNLTSADQVYDWKKWDVKHAYHFLRGTDVLDEQYKKTIYHISIEGYAEQPSKKNNTVICNGGGGLFSSNTSAQSVWRGLFSRKIRARMVAG